MTKIKKLTNIFLLTSCLLFTACSNKEQTIQISKDIKSNINESTKLANDSFMNQEQESKKYFQKYFTPWNQKKASYSLKDATWGFSYKNKTVFLENHIKADEKWFNKQIFNANFEKYNTLLKKAITLKNTNIRVFPTISPMFYNPKKPGEGFPFDYNQNSAIKINTPIFISHYSKDKAWVYMQSNSVGGWLRINDIAFVNIVVL